MSQGRSRVMVVAVVCALVVVAFLAFRQTAEGASFTAQGSLSRQAIGHTEYLEDGVDSQVRNDLKLLTISYDPATGLYSFRFSFHKGYADPGSLSLFLDTDKNPDTGAQVTDRRLGFDYQITTDSAGAQGVHLLRSLGEWKTQEVRSLDLTVDPATGDRTIVVPASSLGCPAGFRLLASVYDGVNYDRAPETGFFDSTIDSSGSSTSTSRFADVPASHPYCEAISGMAALGAIGGYASGAFGPDDPVTRQQFAKMIVLTLGLPVYESDFPNPAAPFVDLGSDDPGSRYPHEYVAVCARNNITKGIDGSHFAPGNNISRAQMLSMVVRAADNLHPGALSAVPSYWKSEAPDGDATHGANIRKADRNYLLAGIPGLSAWDTTAPATRGEVALVLYRLSNKLHASQPPTSTTTTTTTTPTTAPTTTSTTQSTTTTTSSTTTTNRTVVSRAFGEAAGVGGLQITVRRPFEDRSVDLYVNGVPSTTQKPLLAEVTIENDSSTTKSYSRYNFELVSTAGTSYTTFSFTLSDMKGYYAPLSDGTLSPGQSAHGYIAFVVPNEASAASVEHWVNGVLDATWR